MSASPHKNLLASPPLLALLCFALTAMIGIAARPAAFDRIFGEMVPAFDGNIYYLIALHGYGHSLSDQSLAGLPAFYPMWPFVLRTVWDLTDTSGSIAVASLLSLSCFGASLFLLSRALRDLLPTQIQIFLLLCFALNPNSIFHATLYSESWFGLVCAAWILMVRRSFSDLNRIHLVGVILASAIMSLSRPVLLQALCAISAGVLAEYWLSRGRSQGSGFRNFRIISIATIVGLGIGYLPYGLHNRQLFGDFFHPFQLQSLWGRNLGLNWQLIYAPKTVSGSIHVLIWDLMAFYLPLGLIAIGAFDWKRRMGRLSNTQRFLVYFGIFLAAAHAAIAFLTYPIFMSLGRHNLASPLLYVSCAFLLVQMPIARRTQIVILLLSAAHSIHFWARFARGAWMG